MNKASARPSVVFAIPGDLDARTGGYLYDKRIAEGLRGCGWDVATLNLGGSFPNPTDVDMQEALSALAAVPGDHVLLIDGLAYGALETQGLHAFQAPICALVHHPLALESGVPTVRATYLKALETANLALAHQVVVTSPHTAEILVRDFAVPQAIITAARPGTDRPSQPRRSLDTHRILAVGSLTERKGHDVLLAALSRLTDLAWTAAIVGGPHDPSVAEALAAQRTALGLQNRLEFKGELGTAALHAEYASASLFALATRYEGYGMVFAEATAHGLPIISCDAGAVRHTAPVDASILVTPDDPAAFAAAVRSVLTDPALLARLGASAQRAATDLPTWDAAVQRVAHALARTAA
ncbi:MAG TPA: glycosyltransferase family 4 protein [Alphaproteobacteria bacterium]|nr:glycosyltransferase family 4 protein [Alphaproteobacteria bacterium]